MSNFLSRYGAKWTEEFRYSQINASCSTYLIIVLMSPSRMKQICRLDDVLGFTINLVSNNYSKKKHSVDYPYVVILYLIKFFCVTSPVVRYLIPYTDTIPIFSIARNKFWIKIIFHIWTEYWKLRYWKLYFEWDEVSPYSRSVRRLDVLIKMIKDNIVDVLVPSKNLSYLSNFPLSYFYTRKSGYLM